MDLQHQFLAKYLPELNQRKTTVSAVSVTENCNFMLPTILQGNTATYTRKTDVITLPFSNLKTASYYRTLFHELAHSTAHKTRLNRNNVGLFGSYSYTHEELIAEFTAILLCFKTDLLKDNLHHHAEYINAWHVYLWRFTKGKHTNKSLTYCIDSARIIADYILS